MSTIALYFTIPLVFSILAFLFPLRSRISTSSIGFGTLKHRYQKWENISVLIVFIYIPLFGYLIGKLFIWLYHLTVKRDPQFLYEILPYDWMWYVIGCFLTVSCLPILMKITYQYLLRIDYSEYLLFTNIKHGFDGMKVMRPLLALIAIGTGMAMVLLYDYSIKLNKDYIEFNDFLSIGAKSERISDIKTIFYVKKIQYQSEVVEPYYLITFGNNAKWNTGKSLMDKKNEGKLIDFLSKTTNIKIDTLEADPN